MITRASCYKKAYGTHRAAELQIIHLQELAKKHNRLASFRVIARCRLCEAWHILKKKP